MTVIVLRTIIFYLILTAILRLMGKRQIGELLPSEVVSAILISELAALPIADRSIPLSYGIAPIIVICTLEVSVSFLCRKLPWARRMLGGNPIILAINGNFIEKNLTKARVTPDEVLSQVRAFGLESLSQTKTVILEQNGTVSVIPKEDEKV